MKISKILLCSKQKQDFSLFIMASLDSVSTIHDKLSNTRKNRKHKKKKSMKNNSKSFKKKRKARKKSKKKRSFGEKLKQSRKIPKQCYEEAKKFKDLTMDDHAKFHEQELFLLCVKCIYAGDTEQKFIQEEEEKRKMEVFMMVFYSTESNCIIEAKAFKRLAKQFDGYRLKVRSYYSLHYADLEIYKARKYLKILPNSEVVKFDAPVKRPDFRRLLEDKNFARCLSNFSHILSAPQKRHPQMQVCFLFWIQVECL